jgi:NADPH-dependent F420 reductase
MADALAGKLVISVANALRFGKSGASAIRDVPSGSCGQLIQELAPEAKVVVAYNNLPAAGLQHREHLGAGVLVCGKSREAREQVIELTKAIPGTRALDAGPLANALIVEGMTAVVINLNRRYTGEASLAVTGLEEAPERP